MIKRGITLSLMCTSVLCSQELVNLSGITVTATRTETATVSLPLSIEKKREQRDRT